AWIVGLLELLGGAAIVLGLLSRWAALVLALESLVATIAAWQVTNVEFRLTALAAFAALALLGPPRGRSTATQGGRVKSPAAGRWRFTWLRDSAMTLQILTARLRVLRNGPKGHCSVERAGSADVHRKRS